MCYQVYKIENIQTHQSYIGMTKRGAAVRFREHCQPRKRLISKAISKQGKHNFKYTVLAQFDSEKPAHEYELYRIIVDNTLTPNGYNIACNGDTAVTICINLSPQLKLIQLPFVQLELSL